MAFLTISIPAYNDADSIGPLIDESVRAAAAVTEDFEILVIDDGSKDDTAAVVERKMSEVPRLRLHRHPVNLGFGPTIREAYILPQSEWVYFIPGDGQVPATELARLWPLADRFQFILGYRKLRKDPPFRRLTSRVYNRLVSLLAGTRVRDVNSAGLLWRKALEGAEFRCTSAFIHAEVLLEARRLGAAYAETEIDHRPRLFGSGSGGKIVVIAATVRDMLLYAARLPFRRRSGNR